MEIKIKIEQVESPNVPTVLSGIFRVKKYGDEFMKKKMTLDTGAMGTSNFQNVDLFTPADGFKSVSVFQRLGKAELDYLMSIQPTDAGAFNGKMGFLCGELPVPKRPYWTRGGSWQDMAKGVQGIDLEYGTMVFGGQLVKVEVENNLPKVYTFVTRYQAEPISDARPIQFYKLEGMRKADMGKYTHASHPWFIQRCTWATFPDNVYKDTWDSGIIYHPVWSPLDYPAYPVNNGSRALYIACDFVTRDT